MQCSSCFPFFSTKSFRKPQKGHFHSQFGQWRWCCWAGGVTILLLKSPDSGCDGWLRRLSIRILMMLSPNPIFSLAYVTFCQITGGWRSPPSALWGKIPHYQRSHVCACSLQATLWLWLVMEPSLPWVCIGPPQKISWRILCVNAFDPIIIISTQRKRTSDFPSWMWSPRMRLFLDGVRLISVTTLWST